MILEGDFPEEGIPEGAIPEEAVPEEVTSKPLIEHDECYDVKCLRHQAGALIPLQYVYRGLLPRVLFDGS